MRLPPSEFTALDSQSELFSSCGGKRFFLSGGTGFFGKWILSSFSHINHIFGLNAKLTTLSRDPQRFLSQYPWFGEDPALTFIRGDIRDFPFPDGTFDFIIHAATEASEKLDRERPDEMRSVIVEGTRRMLDFAEKAGVSRFLMTSSGAIYGAQPPDMPQMPETCEGAPLTSYGQGKYEAERLCVEAGSRAGFLTLLPRCFAFVGPFLNLDIHFAIGNFIRDCLQERPIIIKGDGSPRRSYLYAADLAEWLWTILLKGEHARPYNVGSENALSILDLARRVRSCAGTDNPITVERHADPAHPPALYIPSTARAKTELGLAQRCPLDEAIRRTLAWHRAAQTA